MNEARPMSDAHSSTALPIAIVGGGNFTRRLSVALTGAGVSHRLFDACPEDLTGFAGVLIAHDVVERLAAMETAQRALEQGCPCLPLLLMGEVVQIGPATRPGSATACVGCADQRTAAATGSAGLDSAWPMADALAEALVRKAAELLRDWPGAVEGYTNTLSYFWSNGAESTHKVMRTVACPICAEQKPSMPFREPAVFRLNTKARPDQGRILALEGHLMDEVTGPITALTELEPTPGLPTINHVVASLADPGWARNGHPVLECGGNELDPSAARAAALGEAIERAAASEVWPGHLTYGSAAELGASALDPAAFDLFLPADRKRQGFPYEAADRTTRRHWVWGTDLARGRPVLVPASHVFVPFMPPQPEPVTDYPLISGFAAGASREAALLSAMLEVIERDSFMIAWGNRLTLQPVDLADGGLLQRHRDVFTESGLEVRLGLIELDLGAPVAIALARSAEASFPATVISAAAAMTHGHACEKALGELSANWLNVYHGYASGAEAVPSGPNPEEVRDETAHGLLFARPDMTAELEFWWSSDVPPLRLQPEEPRKRPPPGQSCAQLVNTMGAAGLSPIVVDLTMPALSDLGLYTLKCIVPGAYPMNFDALWPHLGGRRMREAPVRAGLRRRATAEEALNRVPHPFP